MELDRFYVQPSCSPTRSSLMTGKSSRRLGIHRPLGKNEGDAIEFQAPDGLKTYDVLEVRYE